MPEGAELGLYHQDTRYLCCYVLSLDGQAPVLLAARTTDHASATHFLTNPALPELPRGQLGLVRQRVVGQGLHDDLDLTNHGDTAAEVCLELRLDADFAHIFEVKQQLDLRSGAPRREGRFRLSVQPDGQTLCYDYRRGDVLRRLVVSFSARPRLVDGGYQFGLLLPPRAAWHLCVDYQTVEGPTPNGLPEPRRHDQLSGQLEHRPRARASSLRAPRLDSDAYVLEQAYQRSVRDFDALQLKGREVTDGELALAAGIPWYMALFGRDALIAAYQALPFMPRLARGVLRALARRQGTRIDPLRAEQPGKILHEHREGALGETQKFIPAFPYYGTVDATPLFLMLLTAVYRVTRDLAFVRSLREPALRALEWMDHYGDRDGDGYLEYQLEAEVGLENQGWKDSHDSVRFRDGRLARAPIALCEVQGYAYAARLGMAELFDVLDEGELAAAQRDQAAALRERFDRDFWLPQRGFFAEALDADKRPVDSLTSNVGHLLWCGLVRPERAARVADRLLSPEFFTGWGIRTMAAGEGGYNPISYHNGSIWPHDNGLIAAGLARYGFAEHARRLVSGLLTTLGQYADHRLPELFAGYSQQEAPFVVEYPTASRPQAWASGTVFLLLSTMLGLDVHPLPLDARARAFLPPGVHRLRLDGLTLDGQPVSAELGRRARQARILRLAEASASAGSEQAPAAGSEQADFVGPG